MTPDKRPPPAAAHRRTAKEEAEHNLDFVQRAIMSALVAVVFGSLAAVLAAYISVWGARDLTRGDILGLWVMTGVVGMLTVAGVLVIHRRRPYAPWILIGLLPMAISAFWIFG